MAPVVMSEASESTLCMALPSLGYVRVLGCVCGGFLGCQGVKVKPDLCNAPSWALASSA